MTGARMPLPKWMGADAWEMWQGPAEHWEGNILVVVGSLWVVEYSSNLLVVLTTEHEVHVVESLCRKKLESLW